MCALPHILLANYESTAMLSLPPRFPPKYFARPKQFRFIFRTLTPTGWTRYVEVLASSADTAGLRLELYCETFGFSIVALVDVLETDAVPRWGIHESL